MSIENEKEVLDYIESNKELQRKLQERFKVEVQKEIIKQVELNEENVSEFLKKNQSFRDKVEGDLTVRKIAKALGKKVEELTAEEKNHSFVLKSQFDEVSGKLILQEKEFAIKQLAKDKFDSIKDIIDYSKINKNEDGTFTGLEGLQALLGTQIDDNKQPNPRIPAPNPKLPQSKEKQMEELLEKGKKGDRAAMQLYNKLKREK